MVLILCAMVALSCKKAESNATICAPYSQGVGSDSISRKTARLCLSDSLQYRLDYVRGQSGYRGEPAFCYGRLEMDSAAFSMVIRKIIGNYSPNRVIKIELLGEGKEICDGETITRDNFTSCLVYYIDRSNYACMDYIRLNDHYTEKHRISNSYASVSIFYLFHKSLISNNPSIVALLNKSAQAAAAKTKFIPRDRDTVLKEATAGYH